MTKKRALILVITLSTLFLCAAIFYFGFVYSFRNYSGRGNWEPLAKYEFQAGKTDVEHAIGKLIAGNSTLMWFADSSYQFSKDGWFTIFVVNNTDTVEYIYRFKDDYSSQIKEKESTVLLFSITDKYTDITPTTVKNINKEQVQTKQLLFESVLINQVKTYKK